MRRLLALLAGLPGLLALVSGPAPGIPLARAADPPPPRRCPAEMVEVGAFCIDRWELSTVDVKTGDPLSPYYPPLAAEAAEVEDYWRFAARIYGDAAAQRMPLPELSAFQRGGQYRARAVSRRGVVPQAYLSYYGAKKACESAGKRLCKEKEWFTACGGQQQRKFPYADKYQAGVCNVFRNYHPAFVLHRNSSLGHRDPRLNLLVEDSDPMLRVTGATPKCESQWGGDAIKDMVGNLDEWVEGEDRPAFVGGFYARSTNKGCEAKVDVHSPAYYDYSTGGRCCRDAG
jgi:sulfatase modifying factor 1